MKLFRNLFRSRSRDRDGLRRYVEVEFVAADRQCEYERLVRDAGL
jgi:hypothetical protein